MPVDGVAAARTLLSYYGIRGGYCLFYVWQAYKAHGASTGRSAPTATEAWNRSDRRHPGDRNPPPGVPVFWGPKASSNAGDVVISLGGGRVAATDWPRYGVTGVCTIEERERQIGRPYLGWAECIFDQPIALPAPAGRPAQPIEEKKDMEKDERDALMAIKSALLDGHASTGYDRSRIDVLFEQTNDMHSRLFVYDDNGRPVWDAFQELRQNVRALVVAVAGIQAPTAGEVDVDKLADAIFDGLDDDFAGKIIDRMAQRLAKA